MKIAILGDTHFGAYKQCRFTEANQLSFFDFFFYELDMRGVTEIIQTGDFFDDRSGIRHQTLSLVDSILRVNPHMNWHVLVGNHDMAKRDYIHPNAVSEVLGNYPNVEVYDRPGPIRIGCGNIGIDMIPWICKENSEEITEYIALSKNKMAVGHFELNGFKFYHGMDSVGGADPSFLMKYEKVWSGHYHTMSESPCGRIKYVGTPYTLNFNDANDIRGFHIYDTMTGETEFIENPMCHHIRFDFDASVFEDNGESGSKEQKIWINCINPIDKKRKVNFDHILEKWASEFYDVRVDYQSDLQSIESMISDGEKSTIGSRTTFDYINEYIDGQDLPEDVILRLKSMVEQLYVEATEKMAVEI